MSQPLNKLRERFWERVALEDMTDTEWEALCDGCGRCCLQKLEDEDTGEVHNTDVACSLLDTGTCRCNNYENRQSIIPDCLNVRPLTADKLRWLPSSCAYQRLSAGRALAPWHPLISGNAESVHEAGIGMSGRCISEDQILLHELPRRLVYWDEEGE